MKLDKKRALAARTFGVGKERILFNVNRLEEIKEAITKQDIRDLRKDGAIKIKEIKGKRVLVRRRTRRRVGSMRKKVNKGKEEYMIITRKLRKYVAYLRLTQKINDEVYLRLRKEIRARMFKSKAQIKEHIEQIQKA